MLYATDTPAVVELVLLAHNPDASTTMRFAANQALTWFDPETDLPEEKLPEPDPIRLLKLALLHGDMAVRVAAGDELAGMLKPTSVWMTAGGR